MVVGFKKILHQSKFTKVRLMAGLFADLLGSLQRSPDPIVDYQNG